MINYSGASLYGNYRTRTFAEIFDDYDIEEYDSSEAFFTELWNNSPFASALNENEINASLLFYLLYGRYGNSSIASSDETRFIYQLHSIIFQYGPSWAKELEIQKEIRKLSIEQAREGNRNITNIAENPSTTPSTQDTEELNYVNTQNVTKTKRSIADGAALIQALLQKDVTEEFLNKFKKLFLTIVEPECPLWYATEKEEEEE